MTDTPELPTPIGVFRQCHRETYDEAVANQVKAVTERDGEGDLESLLFSGNTWEVE